MSLWCGLLLLCTLAVCPIVAQDHYIPYERSNIFLLDTTQVGGGAAGSSASSLSASAAFQLDTRHVHPNSERMSGLFVVDNRALDGVYGSAVSGGGSLNTGGYSMGVPVVQGISPEVVPGIDGRQWVTIRGVNFQQGAKVILRTGNEVFQIPPERTQWVNDTEIRVFVNVTSEPAAWSAQVVNPGGLPSAELTFIVGAAAVSPAAAVDFGTIQPGATAERVFTLRNTGTQSMNWTATLGGAFSFAETPAGTLEQGGRTTLTLRYSPMLPGNHAVTARFNLGGRIHQRELSGRAMAGELTTTGSITGRVITMTSIYEAPVPDAEVRLFSAGSQSTTTGRSARTDRDGKFTISNLAAGNYEVAASPPAGVRFLSEAKSNITVSGGATPVTLTLQSVYANPSSPISYPVVLVRGMGKAEDGEDAYWQQMRNGLRDAYFTVWDPNEGGMVTLNGEKDFFENAVLLRNYILGKVEAYKASHGGEPPVAIHLVAHSMGGLTSRQMLSNNVMERDTVQKLPLVKTLITLSTPHAGSLLANLSHEVDFPINDSWFREWNSTRSLHTALIRNKFRPLWPRDSQLRLYVAGGTTASPGHGIEFAGSQLAKHSPPWDQLNDGAVTIKSSQGIYYEMVAKTDSNGWVPFGQKTNYWAERKIFPQGFMAGSAYERVLNHSGIKDDPSMVEWVKNRLQGSLQTAPTWNTARSPLLAATNDETASASWQAVDEWTGRVTGGQVVSSQRPLTGEGAARWTLRLTDAQAGVRLVQPDGVGLISGPDAGVDWESVADGAGRVVTITLHAPAAGIWTLEWDGTALAADAEFAASLMEDSKLSFEGKPNQQVAAGAAVPLLAGAAFENALTVAPVTGGTVEATVSAPDGSETVVTLSDDASQADGAAGDGVHGLLTENFTLPGLYDVVYRFQGVHPDGGQAVRRLARASFTRAAAGGFIAGIEGQRAVDANGDGYPESVALDVRVDVTEAGNFTLAGTLTETEGAAAFDSSADFQRTEAGAGIVNLVFDSSRLPQGRESGPFSISELRLIRAEGARDWLHDYPAGYEVNTRMFNGYSRFLRVTGDFNFGWVKVGQSATRTLRIHNDGWSPMLVGGITLPDGFSGNFEGEIDPGAYQDVEITLTPPWAGSHGGSFEVLSDAYAGTVEAVWSGTGYNGVLLDDWLAAEGIAEESRGALGDPNSDGIPNLLSYLFNIPPGIVIGEDRSNALPSPSIGEDANGRYLALRYRHYRDAERISVGLETCDDLAAGSWQPIQSDAALDVGIDATTGDPIRELRVRIGREPRKFVRLVVREMSSP